MDEAIYDEFVEKLRAKVTTLKVGSPDNPDNYMGPVISDGREEEHPGRISRWERGRQGGGRRRRAAIGEGHFIQPTVIADVDQGARIFQEEIFGPVLAVSKARDFEHALELANETRVRFDRCGVFE